MFGSTCINHCIQGMRYQRRGVNDNGQVANFVETEQTVIFKVP